MARDVGTPSETGVLRLGQVLSEVKLKIRGIFLVDSRFSIASEPAPRVVVNVQITLHQVSVCFELVALMFFLLALDPCKFMPVTTASPSRRSLPALVGVVVDFVAAMRVGILHLAVLADVRVVFSRLEDGSVIGQGAVEDCKELDTCDAMAERKEEDSYSEC